MIRKAEYMIPYHMARCPNYGWKESPEYARAEELKEKISGIGALAHPSTHPALSALPKRLGIIRSGRIAAPPTHTDCYLWLRPRRAQRARRRSAGKPITAKLPAHLGTSTTCSSSTCTQACDWRHFRGYIFSWGTRSPSASATRASLRTVSTSRLLSASLSHGNPPYTNTHVFHVCTLMYMRSLRSASS